MNEKNKLLMKLRLRIVSLSLSEWVWGVGVFVILVYFFRILFFLPEKYLQSQCERKPCVVDTCFAYVKEVKRCLNSKRFEENLKFIKENGAN